MLGDFDGVTFNRGIIFIAFIVLFLFGTFAQGNEQPESEPQQTSSWSLYNMIIIYGGQWILTLTTYMSHLYITT